MGANMRNTIRTSDDDLIVATKVTTDALASATNDLPFSRKRQWLGRYSERDSCTSTGYQCRSL